MEKITFVLFSAFFIGLLVGYLSHICFKVKFEPAFKNGFWGFLAIMLAIELAPHYKWVEIYSLAMIIPGMVTGILSKFKYHDKFRKGFWLAFLLPLGGWLIMIAGFVAKRETHQQAFQVRYINS